MGGEYPVERLIQRDIYFIGKPVFNTIRNAVEVKDLDFHFDTRSFLLRSAAWIFQGPIKRKMASAMTFPMAENVTSIKNSVQETLDFYEIQTGSGTERHH
ncbi:MAG: DUF4403 family protein [Saprospiraceae bacterium]